MPRLADLKCYIVDDEEIDLFLAQRLVRYKKYANDVILFRNGSAMLEALRNDPIPPDYILLNFWMPGLDGLEILERLDMTNKNVALSEILFILTSSTSDVQDLTKIEHSKSVRAFLTKPILARRLEFILNSFLPIITE